MLDLRTDEELMVAARGGDDEAFERLALRLRTAVSRFLRHLGCGEAAVEDMTQETLIRLWSARGSYEERAALQTYAFTIAHNLWRSYLRHLSTVPPAMALPADPDELDRLLLRPHHGPPGPEAHLLERYRAFHLRQAIVRLPWRQRIVFVLAQMEGLPYAQIASMLQIAEGTVKSRMHRAIRSLQTELARDFPELSGTEE